MTTINYQRYEWISYKLEREAYAQQMKGRTKELKHFEPCQKALVFTRAMGQTPIPVSSVVINEAGATKCKCHNWMGTAEVDRLYSEAIRAIPTPVSE